MRAKVLFVGSGITVCIAAGLILLTDASDEVPATQPASSQMQDGEPLSAGEASVVTGNRAPITQIVDDRKTRDFRFKISDAGLEAEGVQVMPDGKVVVTSQETGGSYTQVLKEIVWQTEQDSHALAPKKSKGPELNSDPEKSRVRFAEFFEGVDVEYTYDGKDIEEFFHLSEDLLRQLKDKGASLHVRALLPGLSQEAGAILSGANGSLLMPEPGLPAADATRPDAVRFATGDVELSHREHRFGLPSAVAIDGKGTRLALRRSFQFTSQGLEIGVELPAQWISTSTHPVVIDPSVIDSGRSINAYTWQERNMVRDQRGHLHVAYMAVFNGRWHAMYAHGTGTSWSTPTVISPLGPGEYVFYTPNLEIDSKGTLHAVWADWGYNPYNFDVRGPYPGWAHRLHVASCPNYCRTGNWSFDNEKGGKIITGANGSHHAYHSLAIDRDDVLHIMFEEQASTFNIDGVDTSFPYVTRYFQVANGVITERTSPPQSYHSTLVYVGADNQVYALNSDYYNNYVARHFKWDRGAQQWAARADFPRVTASGCTAYHAHHGAMSVGPDGAVHFSNQQYLCGTWMVTYGKYTPSNDSWSDVTSIHVPEPGYHEDVPSISVDENKNVHLVFRQSSDWYKIKYARKNNGSGWNPLQDLVRSVDSFGPPQIRARRAFPVAPGRGPVNAVLPGQLDVIAVESGATLLYLPTGAPLDAPEPRMPRDHSFVTGAGSCAPEFSWGRVPADVNGSVSYRFELSSSPAFSAGSTVNVAYDKGNGFRHQLATGMMTNGNVYYWRVQASNTAGAGPYSKIAEVGCDTQAPSAFNLLEPTSGADPGTKTPTLTWESSSD